MATLSPRSLPFAAVFALAASLSAQCATGWMPFGDLAGVDNTVAALTNWDPDGPGPLPQRLVVGGRFGIAGGVATSMVAAWDPATGTWSPIGAGIAGMISVTSLVALPNGDLIAGGFPPLTFGTPALTLQRWNGVAWTVIPAPSPTPCQISALARLPNGDLAAAISFNALQSTAPPFVGVWNGTSWSSLGTMDGTVMGLEVLPNGELLALGGFTIAGGTPAARIARWNGVSWSALGSGVAGNPPGSVCHAQAVVVLPNGDLVVGGNFTLAGGTPASNLARWDGATWSSLGGGVGGSGFSGMGVYDLALLPNGELAVAGFFATAGGVAIANLARWNGSLWSAFGVDGASATVAALAVLPNGDCVAGGSFTAISGVGAARVARWDGAAWSSLSPGNAPTDRVHAMVTMDDGSVVAGGLFQSVGASVANGIARWDGASWSALGTGLPPPSIVNALARAPNGDLVAGGTSFVRRWDGASWTTLATGFVGGVPHAQGVRAVACLPNGDIVVGGDFVQFGGGSIDYLARWDGVAWSAIGGGVGWVVHALATLPNGDLIVAGDMAWAGTVNVSGIARWNGVTWSALGTGLQSSVQAEVFVVTALPGGGLLAGGNFTTAGGVPASNIARWDGAAWSPLGAGTNGTVRSIHLLPSGDVIAAGSFTQAGGVAANGAARWNGSVWSPLGAGVSFYGTGVRAMAAAPAGDVLVGGSFSGAGGALSPHLVRLTTTCPATVQATGAGCAGGVVAASLPWTGATWRADASGLPGVAAVFVVAGFAPASLPLSAVFATALPGCMLHVAPDVVDLQLTSTGEVTFQFAIPNNPALVGTVFHHQMVPIALDSTLAVTATNALRLTVGSF